MANETKSLGPESAVLTSIGTLYLYRLVASDLRAFREQPGTRLSSDKVRNLLPRIASTVVSEKGILDAGSLTPDQVESLGDDEIERIAEAYLDSTTVRWYRHEGASATLSVIRNAGEPATKFLDRLIHWYGAKAPKAPPGDGLSATAPRPRPRMASPDAVVVSKRDAWIALGALALLAILGTAFFLQQHRMMDELQRRHETLLAQMKETNAALAAQGARMAEQNSQLRRRIDALEASLHAQPARPARVREAKPKASPPKAAAPAPKPRGPTRPGRG